MRLRAWRNVVVLLPALVIALVAAAPSPASVAVRNVDNTNPGCSDTAGNPYCTIQAAVNAASAGEEISVAAGTYHELVTVNKSLRSTARSRGRRDGGRPRQRRDVVDGTTSGAFRTTSFDITSSNVTLDGFTVENATSANTIGFGIVLGAGTHGSHILNTIVQGNIVGLALANDSPRSER